jgi:transposase-like protein
VEVATSDAHEGLRQALEAAFPGLIWQRCQAHFRRNVLDRTPTAVRDRMHELLDRILKASSPERAREAFGEACAELEGTADRALEVLESGWEEATAVLALPPKYRRRLRTTNMLERFIEEIRRREKVVRIFPNEEAAHRLIGALCAERHEEWSTGRRYLTMDAFFEWKASLEPDGDSLPVAA